MTELAVPPRQAAMPGWVRRVLAGGPGSWSLVAGLVLCVAVLAIAAGADWFTPLSPIQMRMREALQPPSAAHLFGTDNLGRDVASRVFHGTQISLAIGVATALATGIIGAAVGLLSGFVRALDGPLMRVMDAFMAFPALMLAVAITAAMGPSSSNAVIALTAVYAPRTARVVRASALVVSQLDYVKAARAIGARSRRILFRHVFPNCLGPLIVQLTFVFAYAVLSEAALSFLGMGTPAPTPTLGNVIADGRDYVREAPWICLYPGLVLLVAVFGLNLLGDGLRDWFDPRMTAGEP